MENDEGKMDSVWLGNLNVLLASGTSDRGGDILTPSFHRGVYK